MRKLILHIGYPKTGTSTIQIDYFNKLHIAGDIFYFGMHGLDQCKDPLRAEFFQNLTNSLYLSDQEFDDILWQIRDQFEVLCDRADPSVPLVLSNEHFLLSHWDAQKRSRWSTPTRSADRARRIFHGIRVDLIVGVRKTHSMLRSFYVQERSVAEHASRDLMPQSLAEYVHECCNMSFLAEMYDFDKCINAYREAFPMARLHVINFDDLRFNQEKSLTEITNFIELGPTIPEYISLPLGHHNKKQRIGNTFIIRRWPGPIQRLNRLPVGRTVLRAIRSNEAVRSCIKRLKPVEEVPKLNDVQKNQIGNRFSNDKWV